MANKIPFRNLRTPAEVTDPLHDGAPELAGNSSWPGLFIYQGTVSGWSVEEMFIEGHTLILCMNPEGAEIAANNKKIILQLNDLIFIPNGTLITCYHGSKFRFCMLVLDRQQFSVDLGLASPSLNCIEKMTDTLLVHLIQSLVFLSGEQVSAVKVIEDIRRAISLRVLQVSGEVQASSLKGGLSVPHVKKVLAYIDEHIGEHLTIDVLAELVNLSPTHFARAFRESLGVPPHRYIIGIRLDRARLALQQPDASLSEVASQFGFSDHSHFTRLFKERFGCTPSAYRKL